MSKPRHIAAHVRDTGLAGLVLLSAITGCRAEAAELPRSLWELERMTFVPAGRASLEGFIGPLADFSLAEPLLVDLFEVTRGDWLHYLPEPGLERAFPLKGANWGEDTSFWPAYMSRTQAREFAALRGMRLLTAAEWLYAAIGRRASYYPWGDGLRASVSNTLELRLDRPLAVGTFEQGRSPFGCYDMLGNVWEWVGDSVPGYGEAGTEVSGGGGLPRATAMGGSYRYRARRMYGSQPGDRARPAFYALDLDPEHLSDDIGLRCGVEARAYLLRVGREWDTDGRCGPRLRAVGARWGTAAVALLESLAAEPAAPAAIAPLLEGARRR